MAASIEDVASLCNNVIDIFLCRPDSNCRLCFIQVDDVVELGIKTWLQTNVAGWTAEDATRSTPARPYYKSFRAVVGELRGQPGLPTHVPGILARVEARRDMRNRFFHDHNQAGLTVEYRRCLEALIDLLDLFEALFADFKATVCRYTPEQAQYKLLRLRSHGLNNPGLYELMRRFFERSERGYPEQTGIRRAGNRVVSHGSHSPGYEWLATLQDGPAVASECDRIAAAHGLTL
ncbi:hypothetical protein [uncultured Paludibaculum sp.]|uniref:hypothetical protein n=1 Tax=uncultured Paludibaculum sp. TaxID=1765020 RepID=UPI002AAC38FC|nr:hypothetical protein [uncultured Paludibaculum sp.]